MEQDLSSNMSQQSLENRIQNFITNSTAQQRQDMANAISEVAVDVTWNLDWRERILIMVGIGILSYFIYKYSGDMINNFTSLPYILNKDMHRMAAGNIEERYILHTLLSKYE